MFYNYVIIKVTAGDSSGVSHKEGGIHINTEYNKEKEMCQCRNRKCNYVFNQSQAASVPVDHLGIIIYDKVCPKCGSTYGLINYPVSEEHLIYKSKNFLKKDKNNRNIRQYNVNDFLNE
jgi:hypothetical protein